jgi:hypothetical protein
MDDLHLLLRQAAPPVADPGDAGVRTATAALAVATRSGRVTQGAPAAEIRRRKRLRRRTVVTALSVLTAVAGTAAAATFVAAHTGHFGHGGEEGSGEFIRLDSTEFPQVLDDVRREQHLPLPPGASWDTLIAQYRGVRGPSVETTSGLVMDVEDFARCAWQGAFVRAVRAGDVALQQRAADVLGAVPEWPGIAAQPDPQFQAIVRGEAAAAARGDAGTAEHETPGRPNIAWDYRVNCTGEQVGQ